MNKHEEEQQVLFAAAGTLRRTAWYLRQSWTWTWDEVQEPAQQLARGIHEGYIAIKILWTSIAELVSENEAAGDLAQEKMEDILVDKFCPGLTTAGRVASWMEEVAVGIESDITQDRTLLDLNTFGYQQRPSAKVQANRLYEVERMNKQTEGREVRRQIRRSRKESEEEVLAPFSSYEEFQAWERSVWERRAARESSEA